MSRYFYCNWKFSSSICMIFSEFLDMFKSGRKIRFAAVSFLDRFCPTLFDACFEILTWILLIQLSLLIGTKHYIVFIHSYEFLSKDYKQHVMHWSITTNVTPQKRNGRNSVLKKISQGFEEMHHELSKDGENHKLGDVNIPTGPTHSWLAHV